jgi:putative membrane protein
VWAAGFAALWHPELIAATLLLGAAYLLLLARVRHYLPAAKPVPPARVAQFLAGLLALYAAQGSPLELLGNRYLLSAHMLQVVLLVFVAPPLLLAGLPEWLLGPLCAVGWVGATVRRLTHPAVALALFTVSFSLFLLPGLNGWALSDPWLYGLEHAFGALAAFCLWWPVQSRVPQAPALAPPARLLFAFTVEVAMTLPFGLITFAPHPLYPVYAHAPRVLGLSPLADQHLAGS